MPDTDQLRQRAAWYREFAERAGNPWIWAARLQTAEGLEAEAAFWDGQDRRDGLHLAAVAGTRLFADHPEAARDHGSPRKAAIASAQETPACD